MFNWYMADVEDVSDLARSRWFTKGLNATGTHRPVGRGLPLVVLEGGGVDVDAGGRRLFRHRDSAAPSQIRLPRLEGRPPRLDHGKRHSFAAPSVQHRLQDVVSGQADHTRVEDLAYDRSAPKRRRTGHRHQASRRFVESAVVHNQPVHRAADNALPDPTHTVAELNMRLDDSGYALSTTKCKMALYRPSQPLDELQRITASARKHLVFEHESPEAWPPFSSSRRTCLKARFGRTASSFPTQAAAFPQPSQSTPERVAEESPAKCRTTRFNPLRRCIQMLWAVPQKRASAFCASSA